VAGSSVAVVGSRSATTYGTTVASEIAAGVADAGHAVVSGAAFGVDQAAHRGALAVSGRTAAVLACGADRVYPAAHARLLGYLAEHGVVVSEAAPGCAPTRIRFLARNRLIAALTAGTVVVEAALRSGALNTANWAASLSRVLMGVPGPVTSAQSEGVHQLLRVRDGLLVTSAAEVLDGVGGSSAALATRSAPVAPRDRLSGLQRAVLDAVPKADPAPVASIARVAGVVPGEAVAALEVLNRAGLVEQNGVRWRLAGQCEPVEEPVPP
jgi:DNA processing protein